MSSKSKKGNKENLKDKLDGNELDLSLSNLTKVPVKEIAALPKANHIDLSCNLLSSLPDSFCNLSYIVHLDLSKNALTSLPENFGNFSNLKRLDLLSNQLQRLPVSFADLDSLRWLDLKDNPLEDPPKKVIGDCLDDKQCKVCANRVLSYMKRVQEDYEARRAIEIQKQQAKEAAEEALRAAETEKQRKLKKRQKEQEKERRRQEYLAAQRQKKEEAEKESGTVEEEAMDEEDEDAKPKANGYHTVHKEDRKGSSCFIMVFAILIALLAVSIGTYFYCENDQTFQLCQEVHRHVHPIVTEIEQKVRQLL